MVNTVSNKEYVGQKSLGYMVNTGLDPEATAEIQKLQQAFYDQFGRQIWLTPSEALHITLMDWLAPLVNYDKDKDLLFDGLFPQYDATLTEILKDILPQKLIFNRLIVSPSAIAMVADNSSETLNKIRQEFISRINLLPDTKQPPNIVHSTIIRFMDEIAMEEIERFASAYNQLSISTTVSHFRLIRESKLPMLEYTLIKEYKLE